MVSGMWLPVRVILSSSGWGLPGLVLKRYLPGRIPAAAMRSLNQVRQIGVEGSPLPAGPMPWRSLSKPHRVRRLLGPLRHGSLRRPPWHGLPPALGNRGRPRLLLPAIGGLRSVPFQSAYGSQSRTEIQDCGSVERGAGQGQYGRGNRSIP